jgi:type I restriction enzyme M protein
MGNDGGNSGEFYTPRAIIKAMVQSVDPKIGQTVYDGAAGSCGFLIEAYEHMKVQEKSTKDLDFLHHKTFFGNEKTPLAYVMGVMNMILHGIENPNLNKQNTLTADIRGIEEKDRFDIILANPPFGGKEKEQIQANFPIKTNATEMLFLQHFMKNLKTGGKAAIIVPE